ncbi:MAG: hypothetical protein Q7T54_00510 [Candidatus Levybacteria bacterium]|nr:hypothetical protein [Candidatus Levybacteria bacterium]
MKYIKKALTVGLLAGYAGKNADIKDIVRAGFRGKSSDVMLSNGKYHDEWFVPTHTGGGQEFVDVNGQKFTRLYGGGTPDREVLDFLGITDKDVNDFLKRNISQLGEKTRLFTDCLPEADGVWQYAYKVTSNEKEIGVVTGIETIDYSGTRVHIHAFILSPIE